MTKIKEKILSKYIKKLIECFNTARFVFKGNSYCGLHYQNLKEKGK